MRLKLAGPIVACLSIVAIAAAMAGCGPEPSSADAAVSQSEPAAAPAEQQSPASTVGHMLALAKAGEWGQYVDRYYGEQHKFRPGHDDRGTVVGMLTRRAEDLIPALEQLAELQPTLSEDGSRAVYTLPSGTFTLFRDAGGRWTFHL